VYRRKPAPPDWPRPIGIITKSVDLLSNTEWAPNCPGVQQTEVFIAGTEPTIPCNLMPGLLPDTSGFTTLPPVGAPSPQDTMLTNTSPGSVAGRVIPGAVPPLRTSVPRDTFIIQRSTPPATRPPTTASPIPPARDTNRVRVDSVKRGGAIIRRDTLNPPRD
jgi:hypothetical protein